MKHLLVLVFCLFTCVSFCQTQVTLSLPEVALLAISPANSNINLGFSLPSQAGESILNNQNDNTKWLNLTSAVRNGQNRRIIAQLTSGVFNSGYSIVLETTKLGGSGVLGNVNTSIVLSSGVQNIITGIGGAFTGVGASGYNLKYSLRIKDYALLRAESNTSYTITFTLTDN